MSHADKNTKITLNWCPSCDISRTELTPLPTGKFEAVFHAGGKADALHLKALQESLRQHGLTTLFDRRNNEDVLVARGIKNESALVDILKKSGSVTGEATRSTEKFENGPQHTNTRFLSALFYDLGNIAFIVSGIQKGRHTKEGRMSKHNRSETKIGAAFMAGDLLMTIYKNPEDEMLHLSKEFGAYMKKQGIVLPEKDALNTDSLHESGAFAAANAFLKRNILPIKYLTETAAGLYMIHAAFEQRDFHNDAKPQNTSKKKYNEGTLAAGLLLTTGWFSTFLLDHYKPEISGGTGLLDKVRDNPRGWVARPAAWGNNAFNLYGAWKDKHTYLNDIGKMRTALDAATPDKHSSAVKDLALAEARRHDYIWKVIASSSFVVANYLFGISEKPNHRKKSHEEQRIVHDMVTIAANTLYELSPELRKEAIEQAAGYTAGQPHVTVSAGEIAKEIENKIEAIAHNRFALAGSGIVEGDRAPSI